MNLLPPTPVMNTSEILRAMVPGAPHRDEAAEQLASYLARRAGLRPRNRTGQGYAIPPGDRGDIVARVTLKVIEKSQIAPMDVANRSEGECQSYLDSMLANAWISEARKRSREVLEDAPDSFAVASADEPIHAEDGERALARATALLDRVVAALLADHPARYREASQQTWVQLRAVVFEGVDFRTQVCADEELGAEPNAANLKLAFDRVFKRHQRLRRYMLATADQMAGRGDLLDTERMEVHFLVKNVLLRCQRSEAPSVSRDCTTPPGVGRGTP